MMKLCSAFFLLGGALLNDALGEQSLGPLQLGATRGAEAASGAVNEISQHAHAGAGALWRNSLRSQRARDSGSLLRKESAGRMSGIGCDFCDPAFFAAFGGHGVLLISMMRGWKPHLLIGSSTHWLSLQSSVVSGQERRKQDPSTRVSRAGAD